MMQDSRRAVLRLFAGLPSQYRRHRSAAAVQKKVTSVPRDVNSARASKSTRRASAPSLHTSQLRVRRASKALKTCLQGFWWSQAMYSVCKACCRDSHQHCSSHDCQIR